MFGYLRILEVFVLSVLFQKDELNFRHKNFKPMRVLFLMVITANFMFTGYLVVKMYRVHKVITATCPHIYSNAAVEKKKPI